MTSGTITVDLDTLGTLIIKLQGVQAAVTSIQGDLNYVGTNLGVAVYGTGAAGTTISGFDSSVTNALSALQNLSTATLDPLVVDLQSVQTNATNAVTAL